MSVMSCAKNNCENIMCDRYADNIGYICYECFTVLEDIQKYNPTMTIDEIKEWIDTPKQDDSYIQPLIDLNKLFQMR